MNKEKLIYLSQIYNTLCLVETKGENTMHMARCLEALQGFIKQEEMELKNSLIKEDIIIE